MASPARRPILTHLGEPLHPTLAEVPLADPYFSSHAVRYGELSYQQVPQQHLRVMDGIAISQCIEQGVLILVLNYRRDGNLERVGSSRPLSSASVWQMKTAAAVLIALFVAPVAFAAGPPLDTFEARRDWILDTVTRDPEAWIKANRQEDNPFFVASACFARGMDDKGRELARRGFAIWSARNPAWDPSDPDNRANLRCPDFFRLWPAMDCYVRNKEKLDDRTKEDFKRFMTSIDCYAYRWTANLDMMKWTARYLGEQEWGADAFVPSSTASSPRYRPDPSIRYREQLLAQIDDIARTGGPEYASRDYGTGNVAPLLTLAQLAADPEVRQRARLAHESMLARYAAIWLRGSLILTSRRSYPDMFDDPLGFSAYLWVFLGGDLVSSERPITPETPMFNVAGPYLDAALLGDGVPSVIETVARDRARPFAALNRFEERSSGRQISWVDKDYGVFSEAFHTRPRPFPQTYPFGVRWIERDARHHTLLWFSVPVLDRAGYQRISHPHGFNLDAQTTFQHEGTILYVVDTEPGGRKVEYPYGLGYVPGGALAVVDESRETGRVFFHYPGVLIAIASTKPFVWDRQAPIRMPNSSGSLPPGDSEFRIDGPTFAATIETAPLREFPGATPEDRLAAFRTACVEKSSVEVLTDGLLKGRCTNRHGVAIERTFAGAAAVNGAPVDFDRWPMAASRWVNQATPDAPLVVTDGTVVRTYDFGAWSIAETPR